MGKLPEAFGVLELVLSRALLEKKRGKWLLEGGSVRVLGAGKRVHKEGMVGKSLAKGL